MSSRLKSFEALRMITCPLFQFFHCFPSHLFRCFHLLSNFSNLFQVAQFFEISFFVPCTFVSSPYIQYPFVQYPFFQYPCHQFLQNSFSSQPRSIHTMPSHLVLSSDFTCSTSLLLPPPSSGYNWMVWCSNLLVLGTAGKTHSFQTLGQKACWMWCPNMARTPDTVLTATRVEGEEKYVGQLESVYSS